MRASASPERVTAEMLADGFEDPHLSAIEDLRAKVTGFRQAFLRHDPPLVVLRLARDVANALQALRAVERALGLPGLRGGRA